MKNFLLSVQFEFLSKHFLQPLLSSFPYEFYQLLLFFMSLYQHTMNDISTFASMFCSPFVLLAKLFSPLGFCNSFELSNISPRESLPCVFRTQCEFPGNLGSNDQEGAVWLPGRGLNHSISIFLFQSFQKQALKILGMNKGISFCPCQLQRTRTVINKSACITCVFGARLQGAHNFLCQLRTLNSKAGWH